MIQNNDFRWWIQEDAHDSVMATYSHIRNRGGARREDELSRAPGSARVLRLDGDRPARRRRALARRERDDLDNTAFVFDLI